MIPASPAEQRRLLALQQADTAIRQLRHRRANLPEQQAVDENAEMLSRISMEYADSRERLEQLARSQKRYEDDIAVVESRRKSEEGRMYSGLITSEKEVQALRSEISSLRARKNDLEDALLEVMEEAEDLESMVLTLKERHAELTDRVAELEEARDVAARDIDAELAERQRERQAIAAEVPAEAAEYYEELRERKEGVAVAALVGRTCQGCRLALTAVEFEEVHERSQRGLARCEQCGRILVPAE
ncbi:MAG TPA: C4-type zinc ribbon domain-containing protein [Egibacteraceae bacterium]|nr:C4-type zinc ribbon domain-containing protein [Egibacteraceae bacterium]